MKTRTLDWETGGWGPWDELSCETLTPRGCSPIDASENLCLELERKQKKRERNLMVGSLSWSTLAGDRHVWHLSYKHTHTYIQTLHTYQHPSYCWSQIVWHQCQEAGSGGKCQVEHTLDLEVVPTVWCSCKVKLSRPAVVVAVVVVVVSSVAAAVEWTRWYLWRWLKCLLNLEDSGRRRN